MWKNTIDNLPEIPKRLMQSLRLIPQETDNREFLLDMLPKKSIGAEIGVHKGEFSQKILQIVVPQELHLIDPWEYQSSEVYKKAWYGGQVQNGQAEMDERHSDICRLFDAKIQAGTVKIHRAYSSDTLNRFPDGYFDWIYIDGNHLYEYVKQDLELSCQKVKSGGFITGDDYSHNGWWEGGVKKAVDEFANNPSVRLKKIRKAQFIFQKN